MYLTILDYTNGITYIISCPILDEENNKNIEDWIKEAYSIKDFHYMIHDTLMINL
jgi:hypothetical protein